MSYWKVLLGSAFGEKAPALSAPQTKQDIYADALRYLSTASAMAPAPVAPPQRLVREETATTELLATRGWRLLFSPYVGVRLQSLCLETVWDGPTLVAHGDPESSDTGIHAAKGERWATEFCRYACIAPVWGVVALSGKVVEGQTGYRAERATIQSLVLHHTHIGSSKDVARASERKYSTDLLSMRYLAASVPCWPSVVWPDDVSVFDVLSQLEERYQCDVSLAPSLEVA